MKWQDYLRGCFKPGSPTRNKKKPVPKQASVHRISPMGLRSSMKLPEDLSAPPSPAPICMPSLHELKVITQSFCSSNFLGEGGFGPVHKGFIDDQARPGLKAQPVAVKLLNLYGSQGHREWLTGVIFLGELRHAHLVKLIGYCWEEEHRLLVYEYMPRGSLENQLFKRLHGKTLGLAKNGPKSDNTHVSARVMGTEGYAAPEYHLNAKTSFHSLSRLSDVYSFGVVLAELLTVDKSRPSREQNLVRWARPLLKNPRKMSGAMDPRLEVQYSEIGAYKAASLAYQCLSYCPKIRPTMSQPLTHDNQIGKFVFVVPIDSDSPKETEEREWCVPLDSFKFAIMLLNCNKFTKVNQIAKKITSPSNPNIMLL